MSTLKSALKSKRSQQGGVADPASTAPSAPPTAAEADAARIRAAAEVKASQLHGTARAQQQWQEWILKVQMKLIQPGVDDSTMQRASMVLRPHEYDEVTEERVSSRLCAYPPCSQSLPDPAAQQKKYHLSMKAQRVYDVSHSQQYCSETCFLASELYKKGLHDEPFYLRQPAMASNASAANTTRNTMKTKVEEKEQMNPSDASGASSTSTSTSAIAPLAIVEKSTTSTLPPSSTLSADSFAVEGYRPKSASVSLTKTSSVAPVGVLKKHKKVEVIESTTEEEVKGITVDSRPITSQDVAATSTALDASTAKSNVRFSAETSTPSASSSTDASTPSAAQPFLDFTPLPAVLESSTAFSSTPLSRAEFAALTPEQQMDYMGFQALQEKKAMTNGATTQQQPVMPMQRARSTAMTPPVPASLLPPSTSSAASSTTAGEESPEKKIRRRKSQAEKDAALVSPAKPATSTATSTQTGVISQSSSVASSASTLLVSSILCDDDSDPIISAQEIKANTALIRNATLSPFLGVTQAFMRWTTLETGKFVRTGTNPRAPTPASANRQRQQAFLALIQQHWSQLAPVLQVHRVVQRELRELIETFSFDDPIPPLKQDQWRMVAMIVVRGVLERCIKDDNIQIKNAAQSGVAATMQLFSSLPTSTSTAASTVPAASTPSSAPSFLSTLTDTVRHSGFQLEQLDSIFQQWMMQGEEMYQK